MSEAKPGVLALSHGMGTDHEKGYEPGTAVGEEVVVIDLDGIVKLNIIPLVSYLGMGQAFTNDVLTHPVALSRKAACWGEGVSSFWVTMGEEWGACNKNTQEGGGG